MKGQRKIGGRYQTGHEHDGWDLATVIKAKFPATGAESRAVKRDRLTKALKYWARGQLRYWKADWEIYKPMMLEIEQMMKAGAGVKQVEQAAFKRVAERSYSFGAVEAKRRQYPLMTGISRRHSEKELEIRKQEIIAEIKEGIPDDWRSILR